VYSQYVLAGNIPPAKPVDDGNDGEGEAGAVTSGFDFVITTDPSGEVNFNDNAVLPLMSKVEAT